MQQAAINSPLFVRHPPYRRVFFFWGRSDVDVIHDQFSSFAGAHFEIFVTKSGDKGRLVGMSDGVLQD